MRKVADMTHHAGIVLKAYPSDNQKKLIAINDGAQRRVYNLLVGAHNEIWRLSKTAAFVPRDRERIDYLKTAVSSSWGIKIALPFLFGNDVDSSVVDYAVKNYRAAWKNMREQHRGVPKFHKKSNEQSYQTCNHYKSKGKPAIRFIDDHHMILPLLGKVRVAGSPKRVRQIMERSDSSRQNVIRIGTAQISRDACGEYWVALQLASDVPFCESIRVKIDAENSLVFRGWGIDMNLSNFCTAYNGKKMIVVENPRYRNKLQKKIAKLQRKLARMAQTAKREGRSLASCKNYQKTRARLAKLERQAGRQRDDFVEVQSRRFVDSQDVIAVEDLRVKNLMKNHSLAGAIADAGWSMFHAALKRKCEMYGKTFIKVPAQNTTQTCSECGYVCSGDTKVVLGQNEWICPNCGTHHDRDENAAKNIRDRAIKMLSPGLVPV